MLIQKSKCIDKQIIEIHGIRLSAPLGISLIDVSYLRTLHLCIFLRHGGSAVLRSQYQVVLGIADTLLYIRRFIELVVLIGQSHLLDNRLDERE